VSDELTVASRFFAEIAGRYPVGSAFHEICTLGSRGELAAAGTKDVLARHGLAEFVETRKHILDLVVEFVARCLEDGSVTAGEEAAIAGLKRALGVVDEDFVEYREVELSSLLTNQLAAILEDGLIETDEDIAQVTLQRAFGVSYDDYLRLTRVEYERAFARLSEEAASPNGERATEAQRRLTLLAPLIVLARRQPVSLGRRF
jgi:hypothetical protein